MIVVRPTFRGGIIVERMINEALEGNFKFGMEDGEIKFEWKKVGAAGFEPATFTMSR